MNEPKISINGTVLDEGQALTLRLALGCFKLDLDEPSQTRLGNQDVSRHLKHLDELHALIGGLDT